MTKLNKVKVKTVSWIGGIAAVSLLAPTIVLLTQNTSHSDVGPEIEFDFTKGQKFTPVVERKQDSTPYNPAKALVAYLTDVDENKTIAASDSMVISQFLYDTLVEAKLVANKMDKKIEVLEVDRDRHYMTIALTVNYDLLYEGTIPAGTYGFDVTITNLEFICKYVGETNEGSDKYRWQFNAAADTGEEEDIPKVLSDNKDWSIQGDWYYQAPEQSYASGETNINYKNFANDPFYTNIIFNGMFFQEIRFHSDYFEGITYTDK